MREEKLKDIEEAMKLYDEALRLYEQANKLMKKNVKGLEFVDTLPNLAGMTDNKKYRGKYIIHVYKGIRQLAKILEADTEPEVSWDGKPRTDRKVLLTDKAMFFQIGEATQSKYCYK